MSKWSSRGATIIGMWLLTCAVCNAQTRSLGLDMSAWQGNISQTTWNNIYNIENREFVFLRSSRGGTTGFYNQSDPNNNNGLNTLSQRYDDPYFVQNIRRATNAGLYAGSYHFSRPDIIETTQNSGGIANTGTDEADHFIQMAGAWMRPGYLLPVHDLEAGDGIRSDNAMAQFAIDFSDRIHEVMGIRPAIYINGNYANFVIGGASQSLRNQVVAAYPTLWSARWPNQGDPDSIPVQTGHPKDSYSPIYGPWDDPPNPTHPWSFWQYASTGRLNSFNNGNSNLDFNVAQGGTEFVKDHLVPALWFTDNDGDWSTLDNWNSGQQPIAPVQGPGQAPRVGALIVPEVRLPGPDDTVILDRDGAAVTVTMSSGTHDIRKLEVREELDITGGSLSVNYIPAADSTPNSARFSAPVSVTDTGSLSVHTLVVDAAQTFSLGSQLTFNTIELAGGGSPSQLNIVGDPTFTALDNTTASITGAGATTGLIDLGDGDRTWTISDGTAAVDLLVDAPVINGSFTKAGTGTLELSSAVIYTGDVDVEQGTMILNAPNLADTASVYLTTGVQLQLDFAGPDIVASAFIDGVALSTGSWGAPGSGAAFTSDVFSGTGILVVTESAAPPGDFNDDSLWNCADIDALVAAIATGSTNLDFDMNNDGLVTLDDITAAGSGWLAVGGANNMDETGGNPFLIGDANLDGTVDGDDFSAWSANKFSATAAWCAGDFNADGSIDGRDLLLWNAYKFQSSDAQAAVPEPSCGLLWLLAIVVAGASYRRH